MGVELRAVQLPPPHRPREYLKKTSSLNADSIAYFYVFLNAICLLCVSFFEKNKAIDYLVQHRGRSAVLPSEAAH